MRKSAAERATARRETAREIAAAFAERSAQDEEGTRADQARILDQLCEIAKERARQEEERRALLKEMRELARLADGMGIEIMSIAHAVGLSRQVVSGYINAVKRAELAELSESQRDNALAEWLRGPDEMETAK